MLTGVGWAALMYLVLAFPDGRLVGRLDRALAANREVRAPIAAAANKQASRGQ